MPFPFAFARLNALQAAIRHPHMDLQYKTTSILPFLIKVINNANHCLYLTKAHWEESKKARTGRANERVFLHLSFHPPNPSSGVIQHLWWDLIHSPPAKESLTSLKNWRKYPVPVNKLTVAYHWNPNLTLRILFGTCPHTMSDDDQTKPQHTAQPTINNLSGRNSKSHSY